MLVAPTVTPPVTPWSRSLRCKGQHPGATVTVLADGKPVGSAFASSGDELIPLDAGVVLQPAQRVSASQTFGAVTSGPTAETGKVPVLKEPTPAMLAKLYSPAPLVQCGTCLWLAGVVAGADVTVSRPPDPPVRVVADYAGVHIDIGRITASETVTVSQARGLVTSGAVSLPPALRKPDVAPVPAPVVREPLYACDTIVELTSLWPGATVTVDHEGNSSMFCFGPTTGRVRLNDALDVGHKLTVLQQMPACEVAGESVDYEVTEATPPSPWFPTSVCQGDRDVAVSGLREGATVHFLIGRGTGTIVEATASAPPHRFNLPPLTNTAHLGVRQSLCAYGPWSETTWTTLVFASALDEPSIVEPVLHECAAAVAVDGLTAGTRVYVHSLFWGGPIGDALCIGDRYTDVGLDFALVAGDKLTLEVVRCGQRRTIDRSAHVEAAPDHLDPPIIVEPVDDAGGTVAVEGLVPGAWCDIVRVDDDPNVGVVVASHPATRKRVSLSLPVLAPGTRLSARQRLCRQGSRLGTVVTITDAAPEYVAKSADRICQLTGVVGNAGKPARLDTTTIGLIGTDLGIPVWHHGRLYLFFGDGWKPDEDDDNVMDADADPTAWTIDPPEEPGGPLLHWLLGNGGRYHRLHVDGLDLLGNFEVPTGAFAYDGRLYVFVATYTEPSSGPAERMHNSHLAVTKRPANDPIENLDLLYDISSTHHAGWPAGRWLTHASPTVVSCADWPGLPRTSGEGVVLFGTSLYHASPIFLAFFPLDYVSPSVPIGPPGPATMTDPPIPHPSTWLYYVAGAPAGPDGPANWRPAAALTAPGANPSQPTAIIPGVAGQGEVSVTWHPQIRRWVCSILGPDSQVHVRFARSPWTWGSPFAVVFDPDDPNASADNLEPGHRWVNLPNEMPPPANTHVYAPYIIPTWTRFDRSTRIITLHYAASTAHPPYNVQLMRAQVHLGASTP
jgi:hypothetical protein